MNILFLSHRWKFVGILLISIGIILSITYFWFDFRFKLPVFAVYSAFLESKMFVVFRTNFADELIMLLLLAGLGLVVFSREKFESEGTELRRMQSFTRAGIANLVLLILSVLFVYGSGFMAVLVVNVFSFFIFYLIFYYTQKRS